MADIQLTYSGQSGDIDISNGELKIVTGDRAIEQQLKLRLRFFLGEHFLDSRLGIPFRREILIKNPNLDVCRSIFKQAILDTPGIRTVDFIDFSVDTQARELNINFVSTMDSGEQLVYEPFIIEL